MSGAEPGGTPPGARRPSGRLASAAAALLLLGGGAAVAVGLHAQTPAPHVPRTAGSIRPGDQSPAPAPSAPTGEGTPSGPLEQRPVHVRISAIKVSSRLTVVGEHRDGTLQVPQPGPDYDKAAWFRGSPAPGEPGPAVIEGHVDGKVNGPSVFYRLGDVKPGNMIRIRRQDGRSVSFVIYAVRVYAKSDFPRLTVYGNTSRPELRLITCGGSFDPHRKAGGYTSNVVVFAAVIPHPQGANRDLT
jgi:hypothetical protein